jgi:hypothetical protein
MRVSSPKKHVAVCDLLCAALVVWNQPILARVRVSDEVTTSEAPVAGGAAIYSESLKAGDEARKSRQFDPAAYLNIGLTYHYSLWDAERPRWPS